MPENFVLLIFCHICAGSIRPFQVLSVFITCYISTKVKAFNAAWVPMKLMNSPLLMVSHADPLMDALKYNLLGYFLSLAHAQFYNHKHVDIVNPITQSAMLP